MKGEKGDGRHRDVCGNLLHLKTLRHKAQETLLYPMNTRRARNARIRKTKYSLQLHQ